MDKMTNRILQLLHLVHLACRPQIGKPGLTRWHTSFEKASAGYTSCVIVTIELHIGNLVLQGVALTDKPSNNNKMCAAMKLDI